MLKRIGAVGAAALLIGIIVGGTAVAAPTGPGGRLYYTVEQTGSGTDDLFRIYRLDLNTSWGVVDDCGLIASLFNDQGLSTYWYNVSAEVMHPRANADGTATGGDGSLFVAHYFDNGLHTRYSKVSADGTVISIVHPGIGTNTYADKALPHTVTDVVHVVDIEGYASGLAGGIIGGDGYGGRIWHDNDHNDDLTDAGDTYYHPGYNSTNSNDAEIGGAPDNALKKNTTYSMNYSSIKMLQYTGDGTTHTTSVSDFYNVSNWTTESHMQHRLAYNDQALAVGDTDGDGVTDVYVCAEDRYGYPEGIWRLADLNKTGKIDDNEADMFKLFYNDDILGAGDTTFNNDYDDGDLELVQDPTTGKWTLLHFGNGRIIAYELADNGDFAGGGTAIALIADGIPTSGFNLLGIEFDADPLAGGDIPEPGTMLLLGTGVLGLVGYVRRKRMG